MTASPAAQGAPARESVRVNLAARAYDIEIAAGSLSELPQFVAQRTSPLARLHALVITDENVAVAFGQPAEAALKSAGARADLLVVPAGERSKSVAQLEAIWNWMLARRADRKSVVVAVGGGVIGDLAGFAAASFGRGMAFIQVPTTLLAHVDSSVGGKVGVNLPGAKNMVGAFWQPRGVLIDTNTLATLPEREFRSGLAEVVKYGVILDEAFFEWLELNAEPIAARDAAALARLIARCCQLKASVVEQDEREETGLRAVLNYGHTFGHAIEAVTGYDRFLHGEAIAIGMTCAVKLAIDLGRVDVSLAQRQRVLLERFELPTVCPSDLPASDLVAAMQADKKTEHGRLRFVLPSRLGQVELVDGVTVEQAAAALVFR